MIGVVRCMINVVRGIVRIARRVAIIAVMTFYILRILGSVLWVAGSLPLAQKMAEWRFRHRLRRSGLDLDAVDALTDEYLSGISLFGHPSRD